MLQGAVERFVLPLQGSPFIPVNLPSVAKTKLKGPEWGVFRRWMLNVDASQHSANDSENNCCVTCA